MPVRAAVLLDTLPVLMLLALSRRRLVYNLIFHLVHQLWPGDSGASRPSAGLQTNSRHRRQGGKLMVTSGSLLRTSGLLLGIALALSSPPATAQTRAFSF